MSRDKKINDEQLEEEIRKGKTQKQIAHKHGYGYPSETLSKRVNELGFERNQKFSIRDSGATQVYLTSDIIDRFIELSGVERENDIFYSHHVVEDSENFKLEEGDIVLRFSEDAWRQEK